MVNTPEQQLKFVRDLAAQQKLSQPYSFVLKISAAADAVTAGNLSIPAGADFQMLGYNCEYDAAADGLEHLSVQFNQKSGNRDWSNDFEPLKSIATPGERGATRSLARYGYRSFPGRLPSNDLLTAKVQNTNDAALEVIFTFTGVLWFAEGDKK